MDLTILKIFIPALTAFAAGIALAPLVTHYLYKYKIWKTVGGKTTIGGLIATEFNRLKGEGETKTPRMGGIVIWGSVLLTVLFLSLAAMLQPDSLLGELSFLSRSQTWIPLGALVVGAFVGLLNDIYDVTHSQTGIRLRVRLAVIITLAGAIGWWFYSKLDVGAINLPGLGPWEIGWAIIPFFIVVSLAVYASGVIDGIDGLSGGVFAAVFSAYTGIAFIQMQYDVAAFSATIVGAILAFLWFNIPPARFYMTETGTMALTLTLAVVALMTDAVADGYGIVLLPIVGAPLVATVLSNIIQVVYRKRTGKKLLRIAPLHHHFEAIGWPSHKVTMRYWVISMMCAIVGLVLSALLSLT